MFLILFIIPLNICLFQKIQTSAPFSKVNPPEPPFIKSIKTITCVRKNMEYLDQTTNKKTKYTLHCSFPQVIEIPQILPRKAVFTYNNTNNDNLTVDTILKKLLSIPQAAFIDPLKKSLTIQIPCNTDTPTNRLTFKRLTKKTQYKKKEIPLSFVENKKTGIIQILESYTETRGLLPILIHEAYSYVLIQDTFSLTAYCNFFYKSPLYRKTLPTKHAIILHDQKNNQKQLPIANDLILQEFFLDYIPTKKMPALLTFYKKNVTKEYILAIYDCSCLNEEFSTNPINSILTMQFSPKKQSLHLFTVNEGSCIVTDEKNNQIIIQYNELLKDSPHGNILNYTINDIDISIINSIIPTNTGKGSLDNKNSTNSDDQNNQTSYVHFRNSILIGSIFFLLFWYNFEKINLHIKNYIFLLR